ncbi:MAG: bacterial Ig-like domain-containing protein [Streptococcaceae bacterium]|jgi:hypothetical protein|nr:bacterial Ig-like domain-containing protein [Streptococcaceae bacterium]
MKSKAYVKTTDTKITEMSAWFAASNFIEAINSQGEKVENDEISVSGKVNPHLAGDYHIIYSFTDPYLGEIVEGHATVTVLSAKSKISKTAKASMSLKK